MVGVINGGVSAASLADLAVIIGDEDERAELLKQLQDAEKAAKEQWRKAGQRLSAASRAEKKLEEAQNAFEDERREKRAELAAEDMRLSKWATDLQVKDDRLSERDRTLRSDRTSLTRAANQSTADAESTMAEANRIMEEARRIETVSREALDAANALKAEFERKMATTREIWGD